MAEKVNVKPRATNVEEVLFTNDGTTINDAVERVLSTAPSGAVSGAIGDSFYGINHRQTPAPISINKDRHGFTFFTRPRLNMQEANIRTVRQLTPLLNKTSASIQRIIRCTLDPELAWGRPPVECPFVDPQLAFIPILSNHLIEMNGWPDIEAPTFTSHEGIFKEAISFVDGVTQNYNTYDITANFRNLPGDPISSLFLMWIHYMSMVYLGTMVPYPDAIINNEIDSNTRIYRLVMDSTNTRVQKIAATGAAFPITVPLGAIFNFSTERPFNQGLDQITVTFRCMGAQYMDDILIDEFNRTGALFNDLLSNKYFTLHRDKSNNPYWTNPYYTKVDLDALPIFNNRGYPRIDPITYELQWWVSNDEFKYRLPRLNDKQNPHNLIGNVNQQRVQPLDVFDTINNATGQNNG